MKATKTRRRKGAKMLWRRRWGKGSEPTLQVLTGATLLKVRHAEVTVRSLMQASMSPMHNKSVFFGFVPFLLVLYSIYCGISFCKVVVLNSLANFYSEKWRMPPPMVGAMTITGQSGWVSKQYIVHIVWTALLSIIWIHFNSTRFCTTKYRMDVLHKGIKEIKVHITSDPDSSSTLCKQCS